MQVTTYSLPMNGSLITDEVLLDMVRSTEVYDLDVNDLSGAAQTFVASQTNAPQPRRGLLWYKRGEGNLYQCQLAGWTYGATYLSSSYSVSNPFLQAWGAPLWVWVAMAPRLETLMVSSHGFTDAAMPAVVSLNPVTPTVVSSRVFAGNGQGIPLVANREWSSTQTLANAYRTHCFNVIVKDSCATWSPLSAVVRGFTDCAIEYSVMASAGVPLRIGRCDTAATSDRYNAYGWPYAVCQDESTPGWRALVGWARQNQAAQAARSRVRCYKSAAPDIREVAA